MLYSLGTMYLDMKVSILLALFCISVNFFLLPNLGNYQLLIFSNSTSTWPPGTQYWGLFTAVCFLRQLHIPGWLWTQDIAALASSVQGLQASTSRFFTCYCFDLSNVQLGLEREIASVSINRAQTLLSEGGLSDGIVTTSCHFPVFWRPGSSFTEENSGLD